MGILDDATSNLKEGTAQIAETDLFKVFLNGNSPESVIQATRIREWLQDSATTGVLPRLQSISQTVAYDDFTDGGAAAGTLTMDDSVPAGAILLGSKVLVAAGFAGDTSAVLTIGDGSDVDRYMTGTPSVFATAATGIQTGEPSGNRLITAANQPVLTVTSNADFTSVNAGSMTVTIYYIQTV